MLLGHETTGSQRQKAKLTSRTLEKTHTIRQTSIHRLSNW